MTPAPGPAPAVTLRVHGRLDGRGAAYLGERLLDDGVEYAIKDVEEVYEGETPAAGGRTFFGLVRTSQAGALAGYVGARLVLHLEDGRRLPFTVAKVLKAGAYLAQGLGDPR